MNYISGHLKAAAQYAKDNSASKIIYNSAEKSLEHLKSAARLAKENPRPTALISLFTLGAF